MEACSDTRTPPPHCHTDASHFPHCSPWLLQPPCLWLGPFISATPAANGTASLRTYSQDAHLPRSSCSGSGPAKSPPPPSPRGVPHGHNLAVQPTARPPPPQETHWKHLTMRRDQSSVQTCSNCTYPSTDPTLLHQTAAQIPPVSRLPAVVEAC